MRQLVIVLGLVVLSSCAPKNEHAALKISNGSIINGTLVRDNDPLLSGIVAVYNTKSKFICTGSLIAPNIVLTAAHCAPNNPAHIKVIFSTDVDSILNARELDVAQEYALTATDFKVSSIWNPKDETNEFNTGDIALLKFKGALPAGYRPATFLQDQEALKLGAMVTVVGFGVDSVETKEFDPKKRPNLEQDIENGSVYCEDDMNGKHIKCFKVEMSGDGILRTTEAPISFVYETEVQLNERKAGTCSGDSGGPAYIKKNGQYYLFGVTSRGSNLCDEVGVYTNALHYKSWIEETMGKLK